MRDRRDLPTSQYSTVGDGRRNSSQRNLFIGVGVFVVAFLVLGMLLLSGRGDDDNVTSALATNTRTTSPIAAAGNATITGQGDPGSTPAISNPGSTSPTSPSIATATTGRVIPTVTPSDAATDAATEDTDGSATDPDATEIPPDEEPEATETPVDEAAEPTEEPIIGDFGQLPPIQIVSGGLERNVDLEYVLDSSSFSAPETATVYEIQWKSWTEDELATLAPNLGIDGPVEDLGAGSYQVIGTDSALFTGPSPSGQSILQFESFVEPVNEPLPDDGTLINLAFSFLVDSGIIADVGEGVVTAREDDAGIAIVEFKPAEPTPLLAAVPSASVTFGPGGLVTMADVRWAGGYAVSDYSLRSTSAMWNDVLAGEASLDADLSSLPAGDLIGTFTVNEIGLAYSIAGVDYLAPVIIFHGDAYFSEIDVSLPMRIYVQAVAGQDAPSG